MSCQVESPVDVRAIPVRASHHAGHAHQFANHRAHRINQASFMLIIAERAIIRHRLNLRFNLVSLEIQAYLFDLLAVCRYNPAALAAIITIRMLRNLRYFVLSVLLFHW
jgi:hypothetical protein